MMIGRLTSKRSVMPLECKRQRSWDLMCHTPGGEECSRWTNIELPASYEDFTMGQSWGDPNSCMDQGRKLLTFEMDGRQQVRPIGASWIGDPDEPTANTSRPVEVIEEGMGGLQELRPGEAEKLHNLRPGCTDAPVIKAIDRLKVIGGG